MFARPCPQMRGTVLCQQPRNKGGQLSAHAVLWTGAVHIMLDGTAHRGEGY